MKLIDTVDMMKDSDYKVRLKVEYLQLAIRLESLEHIIAKYEKGKLPSLKHETYILFKKQLEAMRIYLNTLEDRAKIDDIKLQIK